MKKILIISLIFLLTSCTKYQEINNLAITTAISIEYNNKYILTLQIIEGNKENIINYKEEGNSITEAYNKIIKKSPKQIYTNQTNIIILDEELTKNKLKETLYYLKNNKNIKKETYIFITKEKNILIRAKKLNNIPNQNIIDSFNNINNNLSITKLVTLDNIIKNYKNKYITIPSILLNDKNEIELSTLVIIDNKNNINYLTEEESITYNFLTNNIKKTVISIKDNNNNYIVEFNNIKAKKNKNNIYITGTYTILEKNTNNKIKEKIINNYIKKYIKNNCKNIAKKYNIKLINKNTKININIK